MYRLVVDCREARSPVPALLQDQGNVQCQWKLLPEGDYIVESWVTVERKTTQDFAISLITGRLLDQVARLRKHTERPVLILEGAAPDLPMSAALHGVLISISVMWYIPVLRTQDAEDTVRTLLTIARQCRKPAHTSWSALNRRPRSLARYRQRLLQGLPGVGPETAQRMLEHFGSLRHALSADERALREVPGIGRKKARAIARLLSHVEDAP